MAPTRLLWPDVTKGLAIILIVLGHVLRGLQSANLLPANFPFQLIDTLIYTIHVPVFFFISGYFLTLAASQSWPQFLKNKLLWIALPYLLWSALQGSVGVLLAGSTNHTVTWQHVLATPWYPLGQFWFLHALLVLQLLLFALRKTPLSFLWLLAIAGWLFGHAFGWRLDGSNLSWPFYAIFLL
ncbi:MAG: DUF1624 domain-containing protein, partial [Proteobacteria bacterium]|nr:DUF1624 domain-containing protein [Pseudomonadota bacterium]